MNLAAPLARTTPRQIEVRSPFDNRLVGTLPEADADAVNAAVGRARIAARGFRSSTPATRRALLDRLASLIARDAETIARTISDEMGKTITEARNEVRRAQNTLRLSGDAATFLDGEVMHCAIVAGGADRQAVVTLKPVGVIAAITPFNYPLNLLCHKLGPAIAAGNAVVAKPSPKAPLAADHLVRLTVEAGFPADLVQVVHGGADTALALARAPIDLLSFTGGPQAGLALKNAAGLVRCLMELGGNDPLIVMPDADLDAAAETAVAQRFEIAGQSCAAVKKLLVHEAVRAPFTERLLALTAALRHGDPARDDIAMGPVIDAAAADEVMARIADAKADGARCLAGGTREGALVAPTVLADMAADCRLLALETFGPVIALRSFTDVAMCIEEVNASPYGLQAGVFTNDHAVIRHLARELQVGGLMVNEGPDFRAEHVPFGGVRTSGLGREGVRITMREMSETHVVID
ncbi:aldehyde dehydrogenase family protein [Plastorhodobacter daqingensis]|uniref:Aldehyde dehydrogenase family protein n=1 Tax=Plastorhodobacter daqingensis TaxID=1387281 RepID=A0ABW2UL42_9RHOB